MTAPAPGPAAVSAGRRARRRRRWRAVAALCAILIGLLVANLMIGNTVYGLPDVFRVLMGRPAPGAGFAVGELRLPRATLGLLAGAAFGAAGATFQTVLRNPLASPDIIGVSYGASAAGVVGLVVLSWDETAVSALALAGALLTALVMVGLAGRRGYAGTRIILVGIGLAALLRSVVTAVLARAAAWELQTAMRWLTGSLNGASWPRVVPLAVACAVCVPVLTLAGRSLAVLRLGVDSATALGLHVGRTRTAALLASVALLAFATAACGPVAFVSFLAGPIAARLAGGDAPLLLPSALVGSILMLGADLVGQSALPHRYPVGVVTGVLGAPYLVVLLVRVGRSGPLR